MPRKSSLPDPTSQDGQRLVLIVCASVTLLVAVAFVLPYGPLQSARLAAADWVVRIAPKPEPPLDFGLILIDSSSLSLDQLFPEEIESSPELSMMFDGFPWSRAVYASAIRKVLEAGAHLVILDILLAQPREGDEELARVIRDYPDRIVLVSQFTQDVNANHMVRHDLPAEGLIEGTGAHVGFANFWADADGKVRSAPFRLREPGGGTVFSSPATAFRLLADEERLDALPPSSPFLPPLAALSPDLQVPIYQLFAESFWQKNLKNGEVFKDRVLAIGAADQQFHDEFQTPAGKFLGAALHLAALGAAWENSFFRYPTSAEVFGFCLLGGAVAGLVRRWIPHQLARWLTLFALVLASGGLAVMLVTFAGWLFPFLAFNAGLMASGIAAVATDVVSESRARQRVRKILERYVSPGVAGEILDQRAEFLQSLGGARREVTVLFSDVRGFTARSEAGDPGQVFQELNEYFSHMVDEILKYEGGVDKFMGDGILGVWGTLARRTPEVEAAAAIECVRAMRDAFHRFNRTRTQQHRDPWQMGIGVHSGPALFGNVGTEARMEPTIIGDTVNLASRIEGLTKSLGVDCLFSEQTVTLAGSTRNFRPADLVRVVGRSRPVEVFTFWEPEVDQKSRDRYAAAVGAFRKGKFAEAEAGFDEFLRCCPADSLANIHVARCREFRASPPPSPWDGAYTSKSK